MAKRAAGKVAIVTGGGSGMGRAGATLLAAEGARVVVADINQEKSERVSQLIVQNGGEAVAIPVDVCDSGAVEQLVARTVTTYGRVDVLYHNAVDVKFVNEQDPSDNRDAG